MGSAKILAALVPRSASLVPSSPVTGDKLTTSDVAGALAGITKPQELLLRYKYLDDLSGEHEIVLELVGQLTFPSADRVGGNQFIYHLNQVALADYAKPCLCGMCAGRGEVATREGQVMQCPRCKGFRLKSRSISAIARAVDVPRETFRRNWWRVYQEVSDQLSFWESAAMNKINQNLI